MGAGRAPRKGRESAAGLLEGSGVGRGWRRVRKGVLGWPMYEYT